MRVILSESVRVVNWKFYKWNTFTDSEKLVTESSADIKGGMENILDSRLKFTNFEIQCYALM